jgi:hypothetical protein
MLPAQPSFIQVVPLSCKQRLRIGLAINIFWQKMNVLAESRGHLLQMQEDASCSHHELQHLNSAQVAEMLEEKLDEEYFTLLAISTVFFMYILEPRQGALLATYCWPYLPDAVAFMIYVSTNTLYNQDT